jgi:Sec-independent protein translocase protein TatA/ElaB/YqjD/DUF883 family membrane-anchored ribosome-binding protein
MIVALSQKAKIMDITSPPLVQGPLPRGMSVARSEARQAAEQKKAAITKAASDLLSAPKNDAAEQTKSRVREQIQEIRKRLNILKSLYAGNPREMAKALAQVFKELKAAIKEYKAALKTEMDNTGDSSLTAVPTEPAPADGTGEKLKDDSALKADAQTQASDPTTPYNTVESAAKTMVGEDGLAFTKEVRGLVDWIEQKMLAPARLQKAAQKSDKATDEAFKELEEQLKALRKEIADTDRDLKAEAPMAGMHLDIPA